MGAESRYERERGFHDERWADDHRVRTEKYYRTAERSTDAYREALLDTPAGARALEYGCGTGGEAFALAERGVRVTGIDLSPVAIDRARREAADRGIEGLDFREMNAEQLGFDDASFDLVFGYGILHHLDLSAAYAEISRVLRPGGRAVFIEPLGHNPLINLYRRLTPSLRTEDEHPLRESDLDLARRWFATVRAEEFQLTTTAAAPFASTRVGPQVTHGLERVDDWLFRRFPAIRKHAWIVLLHLGG